MKEKISKIWQSFLNNSTKVIILLVIIYIFFNIGKSIYKNWQVNQRNEKIKNEISALTDANESLKKEITYFQTQEFKELEARKKLGLKKPDEKLVLIPENVDNRKNSGSLINSSSQNASTQKNISNPAKWFKYVFKS